MAFTRRNEDGDGSLHVLPMDGPGETVTVCVRPEAIGAPAWSPDGTRIAFASRERASRYSEGDDDRARPPRRIERLFSRLDSVGWIIDRPRSVFVVPADGTAAPRIVAGGPYEHGDPAWSPDGRTLAVTAARNKDWDLEVVDDVHLVDVDDGVAPRRLTDRRLSHRLPAFSPDGTLVAVLAEDNRVIHSHAQVVVLDARTGEGASSPPPWTASRVPRGRPGPAVGRRPPAVLSRGRR